MFLVANCPRHEESCDVSCKNKKGPIQDCIILLDGSGVSIQAPNLPALFLGWLSADQILDRYREASVLWSERKGPQHFGYPTGKCLSDYTGSKTSRDRQSIPVRWRWPTNDSKTYWKGLPICCDHTVATDRSYFLYVMIYELLISVFISDGK